MAEKIWYDIQSVPSGGIAYPKDWKISITPYSFGDVLNLARSQESGIGALKKILEGIKCNFGKDLLLTEDIVYLGFYRKLASTKHTKIEFKVDCPSCAKTNTKVMDLKDLKFKDLEIPKLPIIVELSNATLEFEPLNLKRYSEAYKRYGDDPIWSFAYSVTNMEPEEARVIIMESAGEDREVLDQVADLLSFGMKPVEFQCEDEFCNCMIKVQLSDPETLVFPFRADNESPKHRIKFGHESSDQCEGSTGS